MRQMKAELHRCQAKLPWSPERRGRRRVCRSPARSRWSSCRRRAPDCRTGLSPPAGRGTRRGARGAWRGRACRRDRFRCRLHHPLQAVGNVGQPGMASTRTASAWRTASGTLSWAAGSNQFAGSSVKILPMSRRPRPAAGRSPSRPSPSACSMRRLGPADGVEEDVVRTVAVHVLCQFTLGAPGLHGGRADDVV